MTTRLGAVERLRLRLLIETEHPPHALAGWFRAGRKRRRLDASRWAVAQLEFPHSCGGDRARQMRCTTKTLIRIRSALPPPVRRLARWVGLHLARMNSKVLRLARRRNQASKTGLRWVKFGVRASHGV